MHIFFCRELTPGQQECERAVEELRRLFQEIDKAMMNVDSIRKTDKSLQVRFYLLQYDILT